MRGIIYILIVAALIAGRIWFKRFGGRPKKPVKTTRNKPLPAWRRSIFTITVFARLNTRRFFRDRLALFFGIAFPVIFLFIFGGIFGRSTSDVTFKVALLNESSSSFAKQFDSELTKSDTFKVDDTIHNLTDANNKMNKSQLDATIVLPPSFGVKKPGQLYPSGQAKVLYTENNAESGQTLTTVLQAQFKSINDKFVKTNEPFMAVGQQLSQKSLTQFDYTFAGLLGFSIIGLGIFGPVNVFPELKKQGILRRLHTTPLKVSEYFIATMISQAAVGLVSLGVLFFLAITVFHLKVIGNWAEIIVYLIISIITILGIGLAIGGWAQNERQAAPLSNIVVFPLMFLSGTFFPRFLMPQWLQQLSTYLPLTPVIDGIRLMATEGKHFTDLGPQFAVLGGWLIVIYFIAFRVFRWE